MLSHRGMPIHRGAFTHGCFYTEMLFTKTRFYTQTFARTLQMLLPEVLLHTHIPLRSLYAGMLLHRNFYTQTCGYFSTQMPLHIDAFTQEGSCTRAFTQVFLTQSTLYTQKLSHTHTNKYSYAESFLAQKYVNTEGFFNTDSPQIAKALLHFTQGCLYTQVLLE